MTSQDVDAARRFYNRISRVYDALADADEHRAREVGLTLLAARAGERVLEIGYGTGTALVSLARAVGDRGSVTGIDIADDMRNVARDRLEAARVSRVELQVAAIPPIPTSDRVFNAAFMAFTLELFPDDTIPMVLQEIMRVLTAKGRLVVVSMDRGGHRHVPGFAERTYQWMHRHFPHIVDCRPIDSEGRLVDAGFVIEQTVGLDIWNLPVKVCLASAGLAAGEAASSPDVRDH